MNITLTVPKDFNDVWLCTEATPQQVSHILEIGKICYFSVTDNNQNYKLLIEKQHEEKFNSLIKKHNQEVTEKEQYMKKQYEEKLSLLTSKYEGFESQREEYKQEVTEREKQYEIKFNSLINKHQEQLMITRKEHIKEIEGYHKLLMNNEQNDKVEIKKLLIDNRSELLKKMDKIMSSICPITNHDKGRIGEDFLMAYYEKSFSDSAIIDKHSEPNSGDIWVNFSDNTTLLVEAKNKKKNEASDIKKFVNDVINNNVDCGLYVCLQNSSIPNYSDLSFTYLGNKPIGFINNTFNQPIKIKLMSKILKLLCNKSKDSSNERIKLENVLNTNKQLIRKISTLKGNMTRQTKNIQKSVEIIKDLDTVLKQTIDLIK